MAKVVEIGVASETKAFRQGIETGVITPLEDAIKTLRELGDAEGAERLEKSLEDVQRETKSLERQIERTANEIEREFKNAYRGAGDAAKDGMGKAQAAAQEVTREVGSNLGEAVSSIRGDFSDLGQVGQDTLGGLAATLASTGPAGIAGAAVLAAGAVGLGAITAEMQKQQEQADALRDRLSSAYREAAEAGRNYLDTAQIIAEVQDLYLNPEREEERNQLLADANRLGLDRQTIFEAQAGSIQAQEEVLARINALIAEQPEYKGVGNSQTVADLEAIQSRYAGLNEVTQEWADLSTEAGDTVSSILKDTAADAGQVTEQVDELGNRLLTLADGTQIVIEADTGAATLNLDKFKGDVQSVPESKTVKFTATADTTAARAALASLGDTQWAVNMKVLLSDKYGREIV